MDLTLETLAQQADKASIAFLRAELELGFTYANTAKLEVGVDSEGLQRAMKLAKDVLDTIERFRNRITDPAIQLELQKGETQLASLLSSLPGTHQ
jgi:hypothetical protein